MRHEFGLWRWTWSDGAGEHEARWLLDSDDVRTWAPYARLGVAEVVEHLRRGSGSAATH